MTTFELPCHPFLNSLFHLGVFFLEHCINVPPGPGVSTGCDFCFCHLSVLRLTKIVNILVSQYANPIKVSFFVAANS